MPRTLPCTPPFRPADLQEVEGPNPDDNKGAYVNTEGFLTVKGNKRMGEEIASVAGEHKRGATTLQASAGRLGVGRLVQGGRCMPCGVGVPPSAAPCPSRHLN